MSHSLVRHTIFAGMLLIACVAAMTLGVQAANAGLPECEWSAGDCGDCSDTYCSFLGLGNATSIETGGGEYCYGECSDEFMFGVWDQWGSCDCGYF